MERKWFICCGKRGWGDAWFINKEIFYMMTRGERGIYFAIFFIGALIIKFIISLFKK